MHSVFTKTTCQKSAKSMRYRVSPKFEFYRKSLLTISKKQLMSLPLNLIFFRCIPIIIITDKTACYSVFYPSYIYAISHTIMSITWENNLSPLNEMHINQQNHWNEIIFYWYQSYHWYQWTHFLSPLTSMESICEYWTTLYISEQPPAPPRAKNELPIMSLAAYTSQTKKGDAGAEFLFCSINQSLF